MRRSFAPSQKGKIIPTSSSTSASSLANKKGNANDEEVTIQRLPMFGFLEVPEALNKQFKIPSGCIITEKTLELRKQKRLGNSNRFQVIRPGDLAKGIFRVTTNFQEQQLDEDGDADEEQLPTSSNLPPFEPLILWTDPNDPENKIEVIPELACRLRPHQREGVQFLFECTMGLRGFEGQGCILADDMGLGKTLMSITALWTLLNQGFVKGESAVKKIMVVCPTSLVGNWDNEIRKWVGDRCPTFAVKQEPKKVIKNFLMHRGKGVLIVSYETQRLYFKLFEEAAKKATMFSSTSSSVTSYSPVCDMIICDEAHKLKNAESELSKCLNALPARKRILLSGTPMQNELTEFYNMVNFCNPNVLGTVQEFRRRYERPILASREPDALESEILEASRLQKELSVIVNEFILKRGNILNAQHLPPKLVQFVCCRLTPLQEAMYERLLSSKEIRHIREGKQTNTLNSIRQLINICSHPQLILDQYQRKLANREEIDDDLAAMVEMIPKSGSMFAQPLLPPSSTSTSASRSGLVSTGSRMDQLKSRSLNMPTSKSSKFSNEQYIDPEQSGKMAVLFRMMQAMRAVQRGERIVVVSNYTSTLDLIETMCEQQKWPVLRLDGTVSATKRTKLVDEFNNPHSNSFAFLLSSKAGGCGINLIGGNRLVLFDPDWNPASDKQAAGRIWREGQKRRCFIYRFMSSGSIEEKIIQRQLSKEGLVDIVDDKEQVNQFSTDELRQLFTLLKDTRSDTHDTLMCPRCTFVKLKRGANSGNKGPKMNEAQQAACLKFLLDFEQFLRQESTAFQQREATRLQAALSTATASSPTFETLTKLVKKSKRVYEILPFHHRFEALAKRIQDEDFDNLTAYSRRQREIFQEIDHDLQGDLNDIYDAEEENMRQNKPLGDESAAAAAAEETSDNHAVTSTLSSAEMLHYFPSSFSIYAHFLRQWTDLVPSLMSMTHASSVTSSETDGNTAATATNSMITNEGSNCVEQEGCPEETDMNKWSHHCSPLSCDDELFAKALGDDDALVSFIFGLEVNWSLLEQREEETRDEKERRKLQQIQDLEELNAKRRALKEKQLRGGAGHDAHDNVDSSSSSDERDSAESKKKTNKKKNRNTKQDSKPSEKRSKKRKLEDDDDDDEDDDSAADEEDDDENDENSEEEENVKEVVSNKKAKNRATSNEDAAKSNKSDKNKSSKTKMTTEKDPPPQDETNNKPKPGAKKQKVEEVASDHKRQPQQSAVSTSSAPAPTYIPEEEHPDSFDFDVFFEQDRKKLHKLLAKGKLNMSNFDLFWKILKTENNDWRCILTPDGIELFSRTPGLKIAELRKYKRNIDYFVEVTGLLNHFILQCRLRDDDVLADMFQLLLTAKSPVANVKSTNKIADITSNQQTDNENNNFDNAAEEEEETKMSRKSTKKPKKAIILLSDEEDDEKQQPEQLSHSKKTNKKIIVLDDEENVDGSSENSRNNSSTSSHIPVATIVDSTITTPKKNNNKNNINAKVTHKPLDEDIISFDTPDDAMYGGADCFGYSHDDNNHHVAPHFNDDDDDHGDRQPQQTVKDQEMYATESGQKRKRQSKQDSQQALLPSASKRKVQFDSQPPATLDIDKENHSNTIVSSASKYNKEDSLNTTKRSRISPEQSDSLLMNTNKAHTQQVKAVTFPTLSTDMSSQISSDSGNYSQEGTCWTCDVCTFINENPVYIKKCQICKTKRFGSQRVAKRELLQLSQQLDTHNSNKGSSRR